MKLRLGSRGGYAVDGSGRILYHSDTSRIGEDVGSQFSVDQVVNGSVGAIRTRGLEGWDIPAAFAPVSGTPWGLTIEETWDSLTSGSRYFQRFLLLQLALGVAVPAVFLAFGLKMIMRPVEELIYFAKEDAQGNFGSVLTVQSGDEIEELTTAFNLMSVQLQSSCGELERRVVDRIEEFRLSEIRYRELFEESRDAIFVSAADGKVVAANQTALDMFEFTLEEVTGSDFGDRFVDRSDLL